MNELPYLHAIIADPDDDAPRLIYADWLDEEGFPERSDFIKTQIALALWTTCDCLDLDDDSYEEIRKKRLRLENKERLLLLENWKDIAGEACRAIQATGRKWDDCLKFRRGFVEEVVSTQAEWIEHGPEIVSRHPLRRVGITDPIAVEREYGPGDHRPTVYRESTHPGLWRTMTRNLEMMQFPYYEFESLLKAREAINDAALHWSRCEAARLRLVPQSIIDVWKLKVKYE